MGSQQARRWAVAAAASRRPGWLRWSWPATAFGGARCPHPPDPAHPGFHCPGPGTGGAGIAPGEPGTGGGAAGPGDRGGPRPEAGWTIRLAPRRRSDPGRQPLRAVSGPRGARPELAAGAARFPGAPGSLAGGSRNRSSARRGCHSIESVLDHLSPAPPRSARRWMTARGGPGSAVAGRPCRHVVCVEVEHHDAEHDRLSSVCLPGPPGCSPESALPPPRWERRSLLRTPTSPTGRRRPPGRSRSWWPVRRVGAPGRG